MDQKWDKEIFVFMMDLNLMSRMSKFILFEFVIDIRKCQQSGSQSQLLYPIQLAAEIILACQI